MQHILNVHGHDIFEEPKEAKRAIGYLPEIPPLYTNETPEEYLKFVAEAKGLKTDIYPKQSRNRDFFGLENSSNTNAAIKGSSLLWLIVFIHHQSFAAVVETSKKISSYLTEFIDVRVGI